MKDLSPNIIWIQIKIMVNQLVHRGSDQRQGHSTHDAYEQVISQAPHGITSMKPN